MRFFAALLITLSLVSPAHAQSRFTPPASFNDAMSAALLGAQISAWELACEAKKVDCRAFAPPYVGYSLLPGRLGQYLPGELAVAIDLRLLAQQASVVVMIHEMVHYLQYVLGQTRPGAKNYLTPCEREMEAYDLSMQMNRKYAIVEGGSDPRLLEWSQAADMYYGCSVGGPPVVELP